MDSIVIILFIFLLGASVASFLQMYLSTGGKNIWRGRSKCDGCGKNLGVFGLVPVLSWLVQFGKAKCCGQVLSWKYFFGEIILGLWFVGCYVWFGWNVELSNNLMFVLSLVLGSIFFFLVMQDLDDMSVSSRYLYLLCAVSIFGVLVALATPEKWLPEIGRAALDKTAGSAGDVALGALWSLVIFSPFWLIYLLGKYLDKPMIGEADPYVFTALGVFFGTQFSVSLFLYSVWLGAFLGVGYLYFINRKFERNVRVPFLPIIFLASLIILITNFHIIKIQDILIINEILFKN